MINSIGVRNLRSFRKKTTIDIKPLTIFVGRNSSGKSSLIRTFPLLRQSLEANTMGPILWFGRFVDFGTFAEAVSSVDSTSGSTKPSEIEFSFGITTSDFDFYFYSSTESLDAINLELNLLVTSQDQKTIAKEHEVIIDKTSIRIIPNTDEKTTAKLIIENNTIKYEIAEIFINNRQKFLPHIIGKKVEFDRNIMKKRRVSLNRNNEWIIAEEYNHSGMAKSRDSLRNEISGLVINELQAFFNKSSSLDRIIEKLIPISSVTREDLLQELKNAFRDKKTFIKNLNDKNLCEKILDIIYPYIIIKEINNIATAVNNELKLTFNGVKYLAPIRANTERYYRFQDLQVNEMDHTGSNLAMMLNSFTKKEKLEFTKWTEENFGFSIIIEKHSEHYAIYVKNENDDLKYNISDMGFGYSQVLPIILSIWIEAERKSSRRQPSIFIIEQPELHLHPAYQHKLANLFARVIKKAKDNQSNIKIIFETHSQTMINALGICVEDEDIGLDKNDISIIIFDKNNEEGTTIEVATFNNEGYLNNWPAGFFSGRS